MRRCWQTLDRGGRRPCGARQQHRRAARGQADEACTSGHCVGGICCDSACELPGLSCGGLGASSGPGHCAPTPCEGDGDCATELVCCGGSCRDTQLDPNSCGLCGVACPQGGQCTSGQCACPPGQVDGANACADLSTDTANCGACGNQCAQGQQCTNGQCV